MMPSGPGSTGRHRWGTGRPKREFLYVDDFAAACRFLLEQYDDDLPINVGTGSDLSIAELAATHGGRHRIPRRNPLGHLETGRHLREIAGCHAHQPAGLESRNRARGRHPGHLPLVFGAPR